VKHPTAAIEAYKRSAIKLYILIKIMNEIDVNYTYEIDRQAY